MKTLTTAVLLAAILFSAMTVTSCDKGKQERSTAVSEYGQRLSDMVNPLMGTESEYLLSAGNTYPAVALPWGMNFWTPQTGKMGDGWAYTYQSHKIRGLKQTHQPSPWINDYGQFAIMPVDGRDKLDEQARASWFSHKSEVAKPYYYSVYLADHDITAEVTPTERAAAMRFTFPESDHSGVVIDAFDRGSYIKIIPDERTIVGYTTRNSGGVPDNFKNWFVVVFDTPFDTAQVWESGEVTGKQWRSAREASRQSIRESSRQSGDVVDSRQDDASVPEILEHGGNHAGAIVGFDTERGQVVGARVASSFIDLEQAFVNLEEAGGRQFGGGKDSGNSKDSARGKALGGGNDLTSGKDSGGGNAGGDDFDSLREKAQRRWDEVLGRIEIEGGTIDQMRTFYSCLYRSVLFPRKFYEITASGETVHYSPYNGEVRPGYMYTDTGFWDTFRSLFPLLNLVYPSVNAEIQQALANVASESGFLPEWASPGHRDCMVGNNSASVVADAVVKGITGQDLELLYSTMVHGTENVHPTVNSTGRMGHEYYNTLGYVPYDVGINENAARTLEYAYDDWCILQMARRLDRPAEELERWASRAKNYRNLYDPSTKLMRGRNLGGEFQSPFNPLKWGDAFTEGNSLHYSWSVFHDIQGLIDLMGGDKEFARMLDSVFTMPPDFDDSYYGFPIHEITEMVVMNMGNYAHGNQPAQHIIYLYDYARQPWKTQYWVREVMGRLYSATPDGYCGDEDNGQTSAWYIFSALGFYPVCPGSEEYVIGAPLLRKATIHLENGSRVVTEAPDNSAENRYIASASLDGRPYSKNFITHSDLLRGATLRFDMASRPNYERGISDEDLPYSFSNEK